MTNDTPLIEDLTEDELDFQAQLIVSNMAFVKLFDAANADTPVTLDAAEAQALVMAANQMASEALQYRQLVMALDGFTLETLGL